MTTAERRACWSAWPPSTRSRVSSMLRTRRSLDQGDHRHLEPEKKRPACVFDGARLCVKSSAGNRQIPAAVARASGMRLYLVMQLPVLLKAIVMITTTIRPTNGERLFFHLLVGHSDAGHWQPPRLPFQGMSRDGCWDHHAARTSAMPLFCLRPDWRLQWCNLPPTGQRSYAWISPWRCQAEGNNSATKARFRRLPRRFPDRGRRSVRRETAVPGRVPARGRARRASSCRR